MKRYFALALAVLLLFGLTACAGKTPSTETQTPAASETTPAADSTESGSSEEPIIIHVWSEDIETTLPLNEAFYEYTNHKYKIEYTPIPSTEMVAKVQTALAAGSPLGDLIMVDYPYRGLFYEMGILEDISQPPYNYDPETTIPALLPLQSGPNGEFYGPEYVAVGAMAYKRDLTEKYFGVSEPEDVEALFTNWAEFKELGLKVKEASDGEVYLMPSIGGFYDVLRGYQEGSYVNGTELTLKSYLGPIFDTLIDFTQAGLIDVFENLSNEESASYSKDNHIFYPMPPYLISQVLKANDPDGAGNWGLILPIGTAYAMPSGAMLVPKSAVNKEGAVEYLKFIHNTIEGATAAMEFKSSFVSNRSLYEPDANFYTQEDPYFAGQDIWKVYADRGLGQLQTAILVTPYDNDFTDACRQALLTINATRGNCNTDDLLDQIADDLMMKHAELTRVN